MFKVFDCSVSKTWFPKNPPERLISDQSPGGAQLLHGVADSQGLEREGKLTKGAFIKANISPNTDTLFTTRPPNLGPYTTKIKGSTFCILAGVWVF